MKFKATYAAGATLFAAGIALSGAAVAAPIVEVVSPVPSVKIKIGSPYTVEHDLTDNGYDPATNSITAASVVIVLTDDNGNENYTFRFGTNQQVENYTANIDGNTSYNITISAPLLADLSHTGLLDILISATYCNGSKCDDYAFKFVSSTLTAEVPGLSSPQAPTAAVAEPGTLSLLGLGLAGLAALGRRRSTASTGRRG